MTRRERDELNAAIMDAIRKGHRPFCCFGCGDWFVEVLSPSKSGRAKTGKPGRRRIICDSPDCHRIRRLWCRDGRWPEPKDEQREWRICYPRRSVNLIYEFAA